MFTTTGGGGAGNDSGKFCWLNCCETAVNSVVVVIFRVDCNVCSTALGAGGGWLNVEGMLLAVDTGMDTGAAAEAPRCTGFKTGAGGAGCNMTGAGIDGVTRTF